MYGDYYQPQTISNITKSVNREVKAFRQRKLSPRYAVVYLDATYVPLRRDIVSKKAIYITIDIKTNGNKEVLGYIIALTESAHIWSKFNPKALRQFCFLLRMVFMECLKLLVNAFLNLNINSA